MSLSLSREAYAALELLPQWQLRPHLRSVSAQPWTAQSRLLIVAVVSNESCKRLWANIGVAMHSLGFLENFWADAEILSTHQTEQAIQRVLHEQPEQLLIFGKELKQALTALQPELETLCTLHCVEGLDAIAQSGRLKRELMSCLLVIKKGLM